LLPCLTLLYTGIDVDAGLEHKSGENTQAAFVRWVEGYLLKVKPLPWILYAWGSGRSDDLSATSRILGIESDYVALRLRELIDAFRQALAVYLDDVAGDPRVPQDNRPSLNIEFRLGTPPTF
jgi:hypothetical protein